MLVVYEAVLQNGFSIRYDHKDILPGTTRLYFNSAPDSGFVDVPTAEIAKVQRIEVPAPVPVRVNTPPPPPVSVGDIVSSAGSRHQIDPDFLNSVIRAESNFNPGAVSHKGAQGLMQLMPNTANKLGVK
ncbi:MAG: transglycosylase SLT domain-containing protein, partial [Acidobacteria bacterium]|nr:transglycosylase SLT domain-containing protein [Acidobacteriota bacterium]